MKELDSPFHICKDRRLTITEDLLRQLPKQTDATKISSSKSDFVIESIENEIRTILKYLQDEQDKRNESLLQFNQIEAKRQYEVQLQRREELKLKRLNSQHLQPTSKTTSSVPTFRAIDQSSTMRVRPCLLKLDSLTLRLSPHIKPNYDDKNSFANLCDETEFEENFKSASSWTIGEADQEQPANTTSNNSTNAVTKPSRKRGRKRKIDYAAAAFTDHDEDLNVAIANSLLDIPVEVISSQNSPRNDSTEHSARPRRMRPNPDSNSVVIEGTLNPALEKIKSISSSRRKPMVTAKYTVPTFERKRDINTCMKKQFNSKPRHSYRREWSQVAVICTSFDRATLQTIRGITNNPRQVTTAKENVKNVIKSTSTITEKDAAKMRGQESKKSKTGHLSTAQSTVQTTIFKQDMGSEDASDSDLGQSTTNKQTSSQQYARDKDGQYVKLSTSESVHTAFIPLFLPIPRSLTWTPIVYNVRSEDEPVLRYVPYFGDDDVTGVDVSAYDQVPGELEPDVSSDAHEVLIVHLINRYCVRMGLSQAAEDNSNPSGADRQYASRLQGPQPVPSSSSTLISANASKSIQKLLPEVMTALENVLQLSSSQVLKTYERAAEGLRMKNRLRSSVEPERELVRLKSLGHPAMLDLDTPVPPIFTHEESIVGAGGLGLSLSDNYEDLVENYHQLFCLRCFTYDCKNHFIVQPRPKVIQEPNLPFPCPVPGLSLPTDPPTNNQGKKSGLKAPKKRPNQGILNAVANKTPNVVQTSVIFEDATSILPKSTGILTMIDSFVVPNSRESIEQTESTSNVFDNSSTLVRDTSETASFSRSSSADSPGPPTGSRPAWPLPISSTTESARGYRGAIEPTNTMEPRYKLYAHLLKKSAHPFTNSSANITCDSTKSSNWTEVEIALMEKLLFTPMTNESIALLLGTRTPDEVQEYIEHKASASKSGENMKLSNLNFKNSKSEDLFCVPCDNNSSGSGTIDLINEPILIKAPKKLRNQSLISVRRTTTRKEYEPCNHVGPCEINNCICLKNSGFCEKFCACLRECKHRFQGCRCKKGLCRTNVCPCWAASRECDPDLCGLCGVSIHPHFLNTAYKHLAELERINKEAFDSFNMCNNSNIRRQLAKRVYIGRSSIHGWGAFIAERAEKNDFIMEYKGEIITQDEADRRGKIYDKTDSSFLFNLNEEVVIDATRKGNKAKYVNHSKDPNCFSRIMQVNSDHKICLFAKKAIAAGEELSFDYSYAEVHAIKWSQAPSGTGKGGSQNSTKKL